MSGIDIAEEVTTSQLEALAGGELLQAEVSVQKYVDASPSQLACVSFRVHTSTRFVIPKSRLSVFVRHLWMLTSVSLCSY